MIYLILAILVIVLARQEMISMALSDKLSALNATLAAQTVLIGQVKDKILTTSEAAKQLADAEAAIDTASTTASANTDALNDVLAQ